MTKPAGYSISSYGNMIEDTPRMSAYNAALRRAVQPGMLVLDIGAGQGIFSLLACRYGAQHVYAIEPDPCIQLARKIAATNGMSDRITFIQDISTNVTLPERADVMVSDLRSVTPLFEQHIPSIMDARARLLKPGGIQIPLRDVIYAAPVETELKHCDFAQPWTAGYEGLDLSAVRQTALNDWCKVSLQVENLLAAPQIWATLDYTRMNDPNVKSELSWRAAHAGTLHGLAVWFDAVIAEGIGFSNAPGALDAPKLLYQQAFFPLLQPVRVDEGDTIAVLLQASLIGADYVWRWDTTVWDQAQPAQLKAQFKQSTFYSAPLALEGLHKRAASFAPTLNEVDRAFAALADGRATLHEIAEQLLLRFPQRFATHKDALTYAGEMAQRYDTR